MKENTNINPNQQPAAIMPEFDIENGHYLVHFTDGRHAMVDTGNPFTFGRGGEICINGARHPVPVDDWRLIGVNGSGLFHTPVDIVLGCDILRNHRLEFDLCSGLLSIDENTGVKFNQQLPVQFRGGYPIVDIVLNGQKIPVLFDLGAYIGYARKELIVSCPVTGKHRDFGGLTREEWTTTAHSVPAQFCGKELKMELCEAPGTVLFALNQTNTLATFGPNVISFDIMALDLGRNLIEFDDISQR